MAQHCLDRAKVRPVFHKVGCEGMPEGVGRYLLGYARQQSLLLDHFEYGNAAELLAEAVEKGNIRILGPVRLRAHGKPLPECLDSRLPHRHQPFLVALSNYPHEAFLQKDLGYTQG